MGMNVNLDDGGGGGDDGGGEAQESVVAEINITPLTDVFLVLLIIFMVTSTALVETAESQARSGVKVALPKSNAAAAVTNRKRDPIVTVTKDNKIFILRKEVQIADLETELRKALQDSQSETLLLRTDTNTVMGAAVNVMSVGKKVGFKTIAILTEGGEKK